MVDIYRFFKCVYSLSVNLFNDLFVSVEEYKSIAKFIAKEMLIVKPEIPRAELH